MTDDTNNETIDSTNDTAETEAAETADTTNETDTNQESETEIDVEQLQATNKKLYERTKAAEAELKALKQAKKPLVQSKTVSTQATVLSVDVDERIILSQGMAPDLLKSLKDVSKVRELSLIDAQKDPIFLAIKETYDKEQKQKDASLGASKGSNQTRAKKTFNTPGLTKEAHKQMWKDSQ